jgi:RNA polymerase sigma factor (sigma-70 family)
MTYMKTQQEMLQDAMLLYGDAAYRLALSQTGSPADAEDMYQDVFLRLLRCEKRLADSEHLKAWFLRVAINRCRDLHRSGRR